MNDAGVVVGYFDGGPSGGIQKGCIWWPDGTITGIAPAPGATNSRANAINNSNTVVGTSGGFGYVWHDGVMVSIPTPGGTTRAISDTGFVTGYMSTKEGNRSFRWKDGALTVLTPAKRHQTSAGWDVNDAGIVAGVSTTPAPGGGFFSDATVWGEGETVVLPLPRGFTEGSARTINNFGVITGEVRTGPTSSIVRAIWINSVPYLINELTLLGSPLVGSIADVNQVGQLITTNAQILTPVDQSAGDLNGDCSVDGSDLVVVLSEWGPRKWSVADINADGIVDGNDLVVVLGQWSPAPAVP